MLVTPVVGKHSWDLLASQVPRFQWETLYQITRWGLGDGSVVKRTCCVSMKIWVWLPTSYIKSQVWPGTPLILILWGTETRSLPVIAGCHPSSRFSKRPSLKGRKQRMIQQDTGCPPLVSVRTHRCVLPDTPQHIHIPHPYQNKKPKPKVAHSCGMHTHRIALVSENHYM